jgi:hypothetical protein
MFTLLLAAAPNLWSVDFWYAVPAVLAVSLVYAATRHERMGPIWIHAGRTAVSIIGFMAILFAVLQFIGAQC